MKDTGVEGSGVICNLNVQAPEVWGCTSEGNSYDGKVGVIVGQTNNGAAVRKLYGIRRLCKRRKGREPTKSVGGIVGYQGSASDQISNCTVEDLNVTVHILDSELKKDSDAYAKRLILGYKPNSASWPTACLGAGWVNGEEKPLPFRNKALKKTGLILNTIQKRGQIAYLPLFLINIMDCTECEIEKYSKS